MSKYLILKSIALFFIFSSGAHAAVECLSDCGDVHTEINVNLSSNENAIGNTKSSTAVRMSRNIRYTTSDNVMQWAAYSGENIPTDGHYENDWVYRKVDDYISVALRMTHSCLGGGYVHVPFNVYVYSQNTCTPFKPRQGQTTNSQQFFQSRIRIDKKIVSGTYSKNILVATTGQCQPAGCRERSGFFKRVYLSISITVPQSCVINPGQTINVNFGTISTSAFKTAGAIAQGVRPKSERISVKCDNIAGNAQLTMRMLANKTSGNIVVSDNNDVGFRVANNSGVPLIPNNLSSVIPFTLDSNARQNVTIQVYPVSVTGNKPKEGEVMAQAYLRVDFP